jgi:hypothetical protein
MATAASTRGSMRAISADHREVSRSLPTCTTPRMPTVDARSSASR